MVEVARSVAPPVSALARRILGDDSEAQDVAQEVLVDLFRRAPDFDREGDALAWALTLAYWHARTAKRRRERRATVPLEAAHEPADDGSSIEQDVEERRMRAALEEALGGLDARDREVLDAIASGASLDAALRKRKERMIVKLRRLIFGDVP